MTAWFDGFPYGHPDPTLPAVIFNTQLAPFDDRIFPTLKKEEADQPPHGPCERLLDLVRPAQPFLWVRRAVVVEAGDKECDRFTTRVVVVFKPPISIFKKTLPASTPSASASNSTTTLY